MTRQHKEWITVAQAAKDTGIARSERTLRLWIKLGKLATKWKAGEGASKPNRLIELHQARRVAAEHGNRGQRGDA